MKQACVRSVVIVVMGLSAFSWEESAFGQGFFTLLNERVEGLDSGMFAGISLDGQVTNDEDFDWDWFWDAVSDDVLAYVAGAVHASLGNDLDAAGVASAEATSIIPVGDTDTVPQVDTSVINICTTRSTDWWWAVMYYTIRCQADTFWEVQDNPSYPPATSPVLFGDLYLITTGPFEAEARVFSGNLNNGAALSAQVGNSFLDATTTDGVNWIVTGFLEDAENGGEEFFAVRPGGMNDFYTVSQNVAVEDIVRVYGEVHFSSEIHSWVGDGVDNRVWKAAGAYTVHQSN